MTDKEMLELAAKAAGYKIVPGERPDLLIHVGEDGVGRRWMPLIDDGDAFRLAISLLMNIEPDAMMPKTGVRSIEIVFQSAKSPDGYDALHEPHADDRQNSSRRAIVRAAAEIGKAMEG